MSGSLGVKLARLGLCAVVAGLVVVIVPRDATFAVLILSTIGVAFVAGAIGGSLWAMPLVPLAMYVGSLLEAALRDLSDTEDEIPLLFEIAFYIVAAIVIGVWAGAGVLGGRWLQRVMRKTSPPAA